jgi:hypothetical protein
MAAQRYTASKSLPAYGQGAGPESGNSFSFSGCRLDVRVRFLCSQGAQPRGRATARQPPPTPSPVFRPTILHDIADGAAGEMFLHTRDLMGRTI